QRRFPRSVRAQYGDDLGRADSEFDVRQDDAPVAVETQTLRRDDDPAHVQPRRTRDRTRTKIGMPTISVTMPMGISIPESDRARMSAPTRKDAPSRAEAGIRRMFIGPIISRAICGMIRPIQPMMPTIDTEIAETIVATAMTA